MLEPELLTNEQNKTINRLFEHDHTLLVADMGAGKTICTLTAIAELLEAGEVSRVLIIAPLKVCQTVWAEEAANWTHTKHLTVAKCIGTDVERRAALAEKAQITVINFENIPWLFRVAACKHVFDGLVVDELSKLKAVGGAQFKALRPRLGDFKWRVGLTGTPVSEDWRGLFGQMLIIDRGEALGSRKDVFMRRYFYPTDFMEYNWELHDWAAETIAGLIAGEVYVMPDYRDALPELTTTTIRLIMPPEVRSIYDELAGEFIAGVDGVGEVVAETAAAVSGKLRQLSSGFLYITPPDTDVKTAAMVSEYRIDAVTDEVWRLVRLGRPVMLTYWFKADYHRLVERLHGLRVADIAVEGAEKAALGWNSNCVDVLLLHPQSGGHGLNLARGGADIVWLGPVWSRDLFLQVVARLWRTGQTKPVTSTTFIVDDSVDEMMIERVAGKASFEALFKRHLGG